MAKLIKATINIFKDIEYKFWSFPDTLSCLVPDYVKFCDDKPSSEEYRLCWNSTPNKFLSENNPWGQEHF